ncbi:amidohydrolase family protein [Pseudonocardia xishanensis]|uniref:Amidohydrolase family protein n=2 Tax=Pseudonocardia xishanensis TaxID=630995 RepID=A0ABP8RZS1_9PSEU
MTEYDQVIRGGVVVDGTGAPERVADVAVRDGRIVEVGRVSGRGHREVSADGAHVLPGFVDIHTHYDGQATWADQMQPSSWHGVTTVVMGNCGVGFAPVAGHDHDRLIALMEGVEDIPATALAEGLKWEWTSFPEYLDHLAVRRHDVDIAAQVPHAALRLFVMGDRAVADEDATEAEVAAMGRLTVEALEAGALGFSTSRTVNHKTRAGELIFSYGAAASELVGIATAMHGAGSGVIQMITDWSADSRPEFDLVRAMLAASGRPMSISLLQTRAAPDKHRDVLGFLDEVNAEGHRVRAQVAARAIGLILGLECTLHPFMFSPGWRAISHLPVAEQARRMADPTVRAQILDGDGSVERAFIAGSGHVTQFEQMFELGEEPDYEPGPEQSLAARAAACGRTPEELAYDILLSDNGRGMLYKPSGNYVSGDLGVVGEMLGHRYTVAGLSDGGAHVGTICDASFPTYLLTHWARDRDNRFSLPEMVRTQTSRTAEAVGLSDRGSIRPGLRADLLVVDHANLRLHKPQMVFDLPAGGGRLLQSASGYVHTFVGGVETYRDGEATGELPGRLVRGAR